MSVKPSHTGTAQPVQAELGFLCYVWANRSPPQVCCPGEQTKFVPLQWVEFPFTIQNVKWMDSRTLALVDTQEKLHLWDVKGQQQLEVRRDVI